MYVHSSAPCRIGIAGGGSDLPAWTREQPGRCLSLAVAMYTHVAAITRPDKQVVAVYRQRDTASAATEIANGLIRESALMHGWLDGFEVHTLSEVSSLGSGLGVSSSIAVSLAAAFTRLRCLVDKNKDGSEDDVILPDDEARIAKDAWEVEIDRLRRPVGRQDHVAAAFGGLRLYGFEGDNAHVMRSWGEASARWVAEHLLLVQLPNGHDARAILSGVQRAEQVYASYAAVDDAVKGVEERNPRLLGRALDACHLSKKSIPGAVPRDVAEIVEHLQCDVEGVHGCKIAGAGGGGHLVVCCEPEAIEAVRRETGLVVSAVQADLHGVRSEGWL